MGLDALKPGHVAVVTGGDSGIGLAACCRFAAMGLSVVVADRAGPALAEAAARLAGLSPRGDTAIDAIVIDVASRADMETLEKAVRSKFGRIDVLMANAAVQPGSTVLGPVRSLDTHPGRQSARGDQQRAGVPAGYDRGGGGAGGDHRLEAGASPRRPATRPLMWRKRGVKAFAEAVEHDLRNRAGARLSAHLLIPGFVFTGLTANGADRESRRPPGPPEQTVDFMLERLDAGDFYILCPDNDVSRTTDERRILWAAGDIVENRPPLSRWHPDHAAAFERFLAAGRPA